MRLNLRPVLLDVALAAVVTGLTLAGLASNGGGRLDALAFVLAVLTSAPIALRQRAPVLTMTVILGAYVAYGLLGYGYDNVPGGGISLLIGLFTVATLRPRRVSLVVLLMTVVTTAYLVVVAEARWPDMVQSVLVLVGAWVLGEGTRRWGQRTEQLAAEAATAVARERVRIARELHDIVAHHMSVVSLQAGLAEYVLDTDLATARGAITTAGGAGREALNEMRRLLDVLRDSDVESDPAYRPQPGVAALDELLDRTRAAGLAVDVVVRGRARVLARGPDLCAYRIVQESLTNVLKHAGPATAHIDLDYGDRLLTVTVTDDGVTPRPGHASPSSHGIRGMRERAELYGGALTAGPSEAGGFAVVARLPMGESG